MPFSRESLPVLLDRTYANYRSLFKPVDRTPRHNLLRVFASVDAGMYHQLLGDLDFLAEQLFPDTARSDYLRLHWSDRVPPLNPTQAAGLITIPGAANTAVPAGLVYDSSSGRQYYTEQPARIGADGAASVYVKAEEAGSASNLPPGSVLFLVSTIPPGIDSTASVPDGIAGGADGETDEAYLTRVMQTLRNNTRYGKPGDFADWAVDASPEVSKAWEFKNFGVFGALLLQVVGGSHLDGIVPVGNTRLVADYISTVAPPVLFTIRTPEPVPLNPVLSLPENDTVKNRELAVDRLKVYLQATSKPGKMYTSGMLRDAFVDGVNIISGGVKLNGDANGMITTTILELPVLGTLSWE
ncbi:MAG: baseplate J/gp47 family protein [Treponema sp.]|jgi:hypothetical protein|nr:baseplate J/gp47 family protein [Treponema sp.]